MQYSWQLCATVMEWKAMVGFMKEEWRGESDCRLENGKGNVFEGIVFEQKFEGCI